jgi:hypothetical protein
MSVEYFSIKMSIAVGYICDRAVPCVQYSIHLNVAELLCSEAKQLISAYIEYGSVSPPP